MKSSFPLTDATNLEAAALGKWVDHFCQKFLFPDVLCSVHALIKLAHAATYYFSLFPYLLSSLKQWQCDWQLDWVQCKYQPVANCTFSVFNTCYRVYAYLFKSYKIRQECSNFTIISLLVRPRPQSDQDVNWWEMDSLSFAMKNAQGMFQERDLYSIW